METLEVDISGRVGSFQIKAKFDAKPGVTALFGRSGAGKSTILKMVAGTIYPQSGRIVLGSRVMFDANQRINLASHRRDIGYVFQDGRLFPHISVRKNLTYSHWAGGRKNKRSITEVVQLLGLEKLLDRMPANLSGGERQRVAIGRALLSDPQILLMDEPLSSLDWQRRTEILPYLEIIAGETHMPILYVSHDIDEVVRLADEVVIIEDGQVRSIGSAAQTMARFRPDWTGTRSILEGQVIGVDHDFGTYSIETGGGIVEIHATELTIGQRIRLSLRPTDVTISLGTVSGISVRNQLEVTITKIKLDGQSAEISLTFAGQSMQSLITAKSASELALKEGQHVVALVKSLSVEMGGHIRAD